MLRLRPWWTAPLSIRRWPKLLGVAVLAGFVTGVVGASPSLFGDAAGSGGVQTQWDRGCPGVIAPHFTTTALYLPEVVAAAAAANPAFDSVDVTSVSTEFTFRSHGGDVVGGLLDRVGAVEHVEIIEQSGAGDVWISDTAARALGVTSGATVTIDSRRAGDIEVVVRGVFKDFSAGRLDDYWCPVSAELRASTLFTDVVPPPKAIIDSSAGPDVRALLAPERIIIPFRVAPLTLTDARRLTRATAELSRTIAAGTAEAVRNDPELADIQQRFDDNQSFVPTEGITRLTARAESVKRGVRRAVLPLSLLAVVCAMVVVAAAGSMWAKVRGNDVVALTTMGVAPGWIGAKAGLEMLAPVLSGAAIGWGAGRGLLGWYAPASALEPGTARRAAIAAIALAAIAAALMGATAAATTRSALRHTTPRVPAGARWVPFELLAAALAWWSFRSFRSGTLVDVRGDDPTVATGAFVFPLLCLATSALVLARLWMLGLRRGESPIGNSTTALARRRLQHSRRTGAVIVAIGSLAIGASVYGAGLVSSLSASSRAKAGVFVGSDLAFRVRGDLPRGTLGATVAWFREDVAYNGDTVDVLAVDPESFASVAFWDSSFADQSLGDLMSLLSSRPGSGSVAPALAIGDVPGAGRLSSSSLPAAALDVEVVARPRMFPGIENDPLVVIAADDARASGLKFENNIWARGSVSDWQRRLPELGVAPVWVVTTDNLINSSELLFASWTFSFIRALGVFLGALVGIALLLHLVSRQRQQAVGWAMLRRMGVSPAQHRLALMWETSSMVAAMSAVGVSVALVIARVITPRLDPLPTAPPGTLNVLPRDAVAGLVAAAAGLAVAGALAAHAAGNRINLAEAMRDG